MKMIAGNQPDVIRVVHSVYIGTQPNYKIKNSVSTPNLNSIKNARTSTPGIT